jgi:hypothetical protein
MESTQVGPWRVRQPSHIDLEQFDLLFLFGQAKPNARSSECDWPIPIEDQRLGRGVVPVNPPHIDNVN